MRAPLTARTRLAGVVGHPARHSLSPVIHNAWLEAAGVDALYVAFDPAPDRFEAFVEGLRGGLVLGLNVTIPFKERALSLCDEASPEARRAGAANVLRFGEDGRIAGDNTDGSGLVAVLKAAGCRTGRAALLGAGGAARGAAFALLDAGFEAVTIVNRTLPRAEEIAAADRRLSAIGWNEAAQAMRSADVLINATSLGMTGQPPLDLDLDALPATAVVMDMVYRPLRTGLLAAAEARGLKTADGLAMLIAQAAPSFEAFFGRPPPAGLDARALCVEALGS